MFGKLEKHKIMSLEIVLISLVVALLCFAAWRSYFKFITKLSKNTIQAEVIDKTFSQQEDITVETIKIKNGLKRGLIYRFIDKKAGVVIYMVSNSTGTGVGAVPLSQTMLTIPLN